MRLTLRTLLAYLDDTLEPSQAKLIGQKVAESPVAQELIDRIKQVTRRRRLTAPPPSGTGGRVIDPNTVAEYLDNVLPGEQLAETEDVILKSDVHLAEVAACHQILTLFLGQPAQVPPTAKQRMYALLKGRQPRPRPQTAPPGEEMDESDEGELIAPRPAVLLRRLGAVVGVLCLVGILGYALWQIIPHGGRRGDTQQLAAADTGKGPDKPPESNKEHVVWPPEKGAEPAPMPEKGGSALTAIDKVPEDKPNMERRVVGKYVAPAAGTPSVLLQRTSARDPWKRVRGGSEISSADHLVSLPGYRSEIHLESGVRLILWGNVPPYSAIRVFESAAMLHAPEAGIDAEISLDHGRILLGNMKPEGAVKVRVRFLDEVWNLTLKDPDTVVALELSGYFAPGAPFSKKDKKPPVLSLDMLGLSGETDVKIRYKKFQLSGWCFYNWNNVTKPSIAPQALTDLPAWYKEPIPRTENAKKMTVALEGLDSRLQKQPVDVVLTEMRKDQKEMGLYLCMLSLGAIDDLPVLVETLNDERPEARLAALSTLAQWIGSRPGNDLALYNSLHEKNGYSLVQAETIMFLLHGFNEEQANSPETYETLIDYLRNEKLPMRELAWRHLISLWKEGAKIPYNPAGPVESRDRAYEEWKKKIPSGKLPPKPGK